MDRRPPSPPHVRPAFTLIEVISVVAVVGILASLAAPNFRSMVSHYRANEASRAALAALEAGQALAQRSNVPVEVAFGATSLDLKLGVVDPATVPDAARRVLTGFTSKKVQKLGGATILRVETLSGTTVTSTALPGTPAAVLRFCPSSDGYFRYGAGEPTVCGLGNLASQTARIVMSANGETFHVLVRAPIASLNLRSGAT